jgi:hypothetical protein
MAADHSVDMNAGNNNNVKKASTEQLKKVGQGITKVGKAGAGVWQDFAK